MTDKKYLELAKRTLSSQEDKLGHMIIGLVTESAELADAYKKHKYYGRELDVQNIKEEIGDTMWYLIQLCELVDYSLDKAKVDNIQKLAKRYPDGFKDVVIRDQEVELDHIGQTYLTVENEEFKVASPVDMTKVVL